MFKKTNKKGFTLIELIIVVAIMAVLVALLAPNVLKYLEQSKVGKDISSLDSVRSSVQAELTDEVLNILSTGKTDSIIKGICLDDMAGYSADTLFATLDTRLFSKENDRAPLLDDSYKATAAEGSNNPSVLKSKAAVQGDARIAIFLDGNGGVAVAAVDESDKIIRYEDDVFFVSSTLTLDQIAGADDVVSLIGEGE